jgi:hypothetical protein
MKEPSVERTKTYRFTNKEVVEALIDKAGAEKPDGKCRCLLYEFNDGWRLDITTHEKGPEDVCIF